MMNDLYEEIMEVAELKEGDYLREQLAHVVVGMNGDCVKQGCIHSTRTAEEVMWDDTFYDIEYLREQFAHIMKGMNGDCVKQGCIHTGIYGYCRIHGGLSDDASRCPGFCTYVSNCQNCKDEGVCDPEHKMMIFTTKVKCGKWRATN